MENHEVSSTTVRGLERGEIESVIPEIVRVFRDDEVLPWHRTDSCKALVTKRAERGFYITLAYCGEKLLGYSEWIETHDRGRMLLYLGMMQVDCDFRGRGIGTAMLKNGEEYAKDIGASCLRTIPEDERSHAFYRKYGFFDNDKIYYCACPVMADAKEEKRGEPVAVTLNNANSRELIFGLCQSSGRHMYEVANHNPGGEFRVVSAHIHGGYLQLRHKQGAKTALAIYWSNEEVTADIVAAILRSGYSEGFDEIEFYFRSKYLHLFAAQKASVESVEMEREI